jgi:hypothetical protein
MPQEFPCPHCEKKLKVPDHLLGRRVKCPGCGNGFLAGSDGVPSNPNDDEEDHSIRRQPVDTEDEEQGDTDNNESDEDYEEEGRERPPRRRRKRRRNRKSKAKSAVIAPAIAMIVLGVLGFILAIWNLFVAIKDGPSDHSPGFVAGYWTGTFLPFVWAIIVTSGGLSLMSLRFHGFAKFAAVFAMLPCHPCCLLGIAVGIWALVQLNQPDVYNAFE